MNTRSKALINKYHSTESSSTVPKQMDVAARSIDLITTILKSAGTVGQVAQDILAWRSREGIDEAQLTYTLGLALDFCRPNLKGGIIRSVLQLKADELYGLRLTTSGAIGRSILRDDGLCWLATTHAVLFRYHDLEVSAETICDLVLSNHVAEDDNRRIVYLARVRPVLDQMVESIALHTTNIGVGVNPLPPELRTLKSHFLAPYAFSAAVHAVTSNKKLSLVVKVKYSITDLLDWIYNHWDGEFQVTLGANVIYHEQLGDSTRRLIFLIEESCAEDEDCGDPEHIGAVGISTLSGGQISDSLNPPFYVCITDPAAGTEARGYRTELYSLNFRANRLIRLNEREIQLVKKSAQDIVKSMVQLHVDPDAPSTCRLGLHTSEHSVGARLGWWMKRTPAILQPNYGSQAKPRQLFRPDPELVEDAEMDLDSESAPEGSIPVGGRLMVPDDYDVYDVPDLLRDYPEIAQVAQEAKDRCQCGCRTRDSLDSIDNGNCLQALATAQTILLIGHAIADSMGITDVSNLSGGNGPRCIIDATIVVLADIATRGCIDWRHWFKVACSAVTGMDHDIVDGITTVDAGGELVAWTCGSMTIIPAWFDMNKKMDLQHSWGVHVCHGKPESLMAERAVFETQLTTGPDTRNTERHVGNRALDLDVDEVSLDADMHVKVFSTVIASKQALHRLMTLVTTEKSIRILDPTAVYQGMMHAVVPICAHVPQATYGNLATFDEVLCCSKEWRTGDSDPIEVYLGGYDVLKVNIAVALSKGRTVLRKAEQCCLRCAVEEAEQLGYQCVSIRDTRRRSKRLAPTPSSS